MKNNEFYLNKVTQTDYRGGINKKKHMKKESNLIENEIEPITDPLSDIEKDELKEKITEGLEIILKNILPETEHDAILKGPLVSELHQKLGL